MDSFVALDVGERRIGVAVARADVRIATPLTTLANGDDIFEQIVSLIEEQHAVSVVVGLPLGMDGQETAQTHAVQTFVGQLRGHIKLPLYWQDEALTSHKAEEELASRGKPFAKGDVDALAATFILEDFLREQSPEPMA
ncbi:MAG TPA: Holliday junction resolvase RuvX [Candidatus Saccharimonadales bacterium]